MHLTEPAYGCVRLLIHLSLLGFKILISGKIRSLIEFLVVLVCTKNSPNFCRHLSKFVIRLKNLSVGHKTVIREALCISDADFHTCIFQWLVSRTAAKALTEVRV